MEGKACQKTRCSASTIFQLSGESFEDLRAKGAFISFYFPGSSVTQNIENMKHFFAGCRDIRQPVASAGRQTAKTLDETVVTASKTPSNNHKPKVVTVIAKNN